jgi:hypothetical protein
MPAATGKDGGGQWDARLYTMAGSLGKGPVENEDLVLRSFERFWNERPFDYGFDPFSSGLARWTAH